MNIDEGEALLAAAQNDNSDNGRHRADWRGWLAENAPALIAALREAQRDAERLDWLLDNALNIYLGRPHHFVLPANDRAAIDAARAKP